MAWLAKSRKDKTLSRNNKTYLSFRLDLSSYPKCHFEINQLLGDLPGVLWYWVPENETVPLSYNLSSIPLCYGLWRVSLFLFIYLPFLLGLVQKRMILISTKCQKGVKTPYPKTESAPFWHLTDNVMPRGPFKFLVAPEPPYDKSLQLLWSWCSCGEESEVWVLSLFSLN